MSSFERSTLLWTGANFFVILLTGFFICLQWLEMRSGGKDTHDLAVAAKDQATLMREQLEGTQAAVLKHSDGISVESITFGLANTRDVDAVNVHVEIMISRLILPNT